MISTSHIGYLWLIAGLIFLFAELGAPGLFFFVAFAIGCFLAFPFALADYAFVTQCWVALAGSVVAFLVLRRLFAARVQGDKVKTNVSALVGRDAVVLEAVGQHERGYVRVGNEVWPARSNQAQTYQPGTHVRVVQVSGNHVVVQLK